MTDDGASRPRPANRKRPVILQARFSAEEAAPAASVRDQDLP